ncbi:hypothetical protein LCGC14_1318000 [marine sediment metagenome]|uniref:Uncharacterized protein n=1 Tax=marine sediment metagenome TaxID=412755 RepID=A0A0F9NMM4_9ZZZZ
MLEKGDNVILPNDQRGAVQGWAIEQSIADYPKRNPYKRVSRKKALDSDAPLVEIWNMAKHSSEPNEFWPLDAIKGTE